MSVCFKAMEAKSYRSNRVDDMHFRNLSKQGTNIS